MQSTRRAARGRTDAAPSIRASPGAAIPCISIGKIGHQSSFLKSNGYTDIFGKVLWAKYLVESPERPLEVDVLPKKLHKTFLVYLQIATAAALVLSCPDVDVTMCSDLRDMIIYVV